MIIIIIMIMIMIIIIIIIIIGTNATNFFSITEFKQQCSPGSKGFCC